MEPQPSIDRDPSVAEMLPTALMTAATEPVLVSVGDWMVTQAGVAVELIANRSQIGELLRGGPSIDVDIDYKTADGTERSVTVPICAVRLDLNQRDDASWFAAVPAMSESTGIPDGVRVVRVGKT